LPNEQLYDLAIRAAEMNDAAALAQLMCELGYETTESEMQMRLERIVTDYIAHLWRFVRAKCAG
jgi:hypothetical protein